MVQYMLEQCDDERFKQIIARLPRHAFMELTGMRVLHEEEVEEQRVNSTVVLKYLHRCRGTTGKLLTLTLLCFHVYALARLLRAKQSLSELGLGLLSPLAISILNSAVPRIIKMIVLAENHVHHLSELQAILSRIFAFKVIQLFVILYSLTQISSASKGS